MTALKPFVQKKKPISFPEKRFDPVGAFPAEQEQYILLEGVQVIFAFNQLRKTIDTFPEVCMPTDDIEPADPLCFIQHGPVPSQA